MYRPQTKTEKELEYKNNPLELAGKNSLTDLSIMKQYVICKVNVKFFLCLTN
jgi:hypothetical protein